MSNYYLYIIMLEITGFHYRYYYYYYYTRTRIEYYIVRVSKTQKRQRFASHASVLNTTFFYTLIIVII